MTVKISQLPVTVTPNRGFSIPGMNEVGDTFQVTVGQILSLLQLGGLANGDDAGDIPFDNSMVGLAGNPTNVQAALDAIKTAAAFTGNPTAVTQTAGNNTTRLATTAFAKTAIGKLPTFYESTPQVITFAGQLVLAHGLGAIPKLIQPHLLNITAQSGYVPGDRVIVNPAQNDPAGNGGRGMSLVPDATNITIRFSNSATTQAFGVMNKTTGGAFQITNTSWRLVVRAWT